MGKKTKTNVKQPLEARVEDAALIVAYLEYVRSDVGTLSPLGAHLLGMAIQQLVEDTGLSKEPEVSADLYT